MRKTTITSLFLLVCSISFAQSNSYWQQKADYKMDVKMDVKNYTYTGTQELIYTNNSPDTLKKVYFHLFNNAFQPGSEMDARLQSISDPDRRMVKTFKTPEKTTYESRISALKPNEIGFLKVLDFKQDGQSAETKTIGTILEVQLQKPILPNQKSTFTFNFDGQVPLQIRRSGRNSSEGIALSMAQWYPKMAEYDFQGWHADPYIAREFHGVWGNFDVKISLDKDYIIGGTGYLQNPNEIGYGYQDDGVVVKHSRKTKTLTWHFLAPDVHDFTWAADKDYIHDTAQVPGGAKLHFFYKNNPDIKENWKNLQPKAVQLMEFFNANVGPYPYKQYSIIQGGDGGMEYAMSTLILGNGTMQGLQGVTAHEMAHSWFQFVLATNESKHYWMDEGFTSFISDLAENAINEKKVDNPLEGSYKSYAFMVNSGKELPQTTHADRHDVNQIYSISAYSKGSVFLSQLGYVIGNENLMKTLRRYYKEFAFKHPTPNDFIRIAEKVSDTQLEWYLNDWTRTTNTIDYSIKEVVEKENKTSITLERIGRMPMPIDLYVEYTDGTAETFYIPLRMMFGEKLNPFTNLKRTVLADWAWSFGTYQFSIDKPKKSIKQIIIDPTEMMADIEKENNVYIQE
ncbi:M1 family metallopeptidase [Flavobacterium tegetincola]|uniref:M1 family metallopeptidase n=1 Tax=Flavobacterium tegetincola TaxID=150172 RepID=UPI0003FF0CE2|nr:M1 family metallopeptidase [Flavobacterium tegetincola]